MAHDELKFADDRPITTQAQDLLDRGGFAQRLALAINSWQHQESLVISLTGGWGSGKSSIKNMTIEQLKASRGCQLIEFNPWQWASQDSLSKAFFEEISRAIQRKDASEQDKKLAKLLRHYGRYLNVGASVVTTTAKWTPILLGSALVTTGLASVAQGNAAQVAVGILSAASWLGAAGPWLKKFGLWATNHSKSLEQQAKENALTLSEIRTELQQLLNARQKPLVIVLDDLDRLSAEQMKAMFQLVKAHMDFANVVFLLLFQRDTVEQGLTKVGFDGAAYLEKIIQAPLSVPTVAGGQLQTVLFSRLDAILAEEPQLQQRFDQEYWQQVFERGIRPFFRNLRHVYRYASTLAFHCRLLRGTEVAEVNAVDLFALECLRVFAPQTHAQLPHHKELLTDSEPFTRKDQTQRERINQVIDQLVDLAPELHQSNTRRLLQTLFPTLDWVFSNGEHDELTKARWLIDSRVCRDEVFDRYFEFSIPQQDIPNSLLHELGRLITEPEFFTTLLTAHEEDRQAEILQRLLGLVEEFPLEHSLAVVQTLLYAGDQVGRRMSFTNWSPRLQVARLLRLFLRRHEQAAERSQLVIQAFTLGIGLVTVNQLLAAETALRRKGDVGDLDDEGLSRLKSTYLHSLSQWADRDPNAFLADADVATYLLDWNRYGEEGDEGRRWVNQHVDSISRFFQFARGHLSSRSSHSGGAMTRLDYVSPRVQEQVMGLERCAQWVTQIDEAPLAAMDLQTLNLVKDALARHARGDTSDWVE
ncbi:AAA family ATPase [Pseudomonas asiatica]|uniref:KAP family P-loop NTPase fold protein n=1 Tax=Pseudomonas asiatica TaxID=2219225 RepID=UPI0016679070|nr:P-loop NTPase fold protein [Pseudomonas asiatica]QNT38788.1 AAA family ATPase [Pseudomonas asiatica]